MRTILAAALFLASPLGAQTPDIGRIVETHVIPGYQALADETASLASAAGEGCSAEAPFTSEAMFEAYGSAFDAWIKVSHLRFGPSEQDDRAFALAFWPDPRGSTPKTLAALVRDRDDVVNAPQDFATVSVAARGFYALEFLLFDEGLLEPQDAAFRCMLLQAVTGDIASNSAAILAGWQDGYADLIANPGNDTYRTTTEAAQQLFTALTTGLEFAETTRLGRPLGTFERPRPNRAEARRSGRSLRHVVLSLEATRELAFLIAADPALDQDFADAIEDAMSLDDPVFAGVADPARRFRIEVLQQDITNLRRYLLEQVGPRFGITAGFNSLDGD